MSALDLLLARKARLAGLLGAASLVGAMLWLRRHPSACPYSLRFSLEPPHPLITRARLREILEPQPGERILEIGPGTGYYTLPLAEWIGPEGQLDILDIQQAMLDDTMRRARERRIENVTPTCADAQHLPYPDETFDAVVLVTTLGEIPDQDAAWREMARVLKPAGRIVNGELFGDPHWVSPQAAEQHAATAGLASHRRLGPSAGYFGRHARLSGEQITTAQSRGRRSTSDSGGGGSTVASFARSRPAPQAEASSGASVRAGNLRGNGLLTFPKKRRQSISRRCAAPFRAIRQSRRPRRECRSSSEPGVSADLAQTRTSLEKHNSPLSGLRRSGRLTATLN